MPPRLPGLLVPVLLLLVVTSARGMQTPAGAGRVYRHEWGHVLSLDGDWQIAEGRAAVRPKSFSGTVPVPGLVTSAQPAFPDVGVEGGPREAFWYRRTFTVPGALPAVARLKIGKAMFGTRVYLNGHEVGHSWSSFTPLYFPVRDHLRPAGQENELVIAVGAHLSALPDSVVTGGDPERHRYVPGIYDRVELLLSGDPYVLRAQVAPRLDRRGIEVAVEFANEGKNAASLDVEARVYAWKSGERAAGSVIRSGVLQPGSVTQVKTWLPMPEFETWTPDNPVLYVLELRRGDEVYETRFGMRSFAVDPDQTNRALLNGEPCFLRGTNFGIHRFFEDAECQQRPWDERWVRQLFRRFREMDMNAVRFAIGPAPGGWYDIADEEGMMIFDEAAIWYAYQPEVGDVSKELADPSKKWGVWPKNLTSETLVRDYTAWLQERWNHPSVIVWDAQNETWARQTGEAIDQVRHLDLSGRPWDNGWSPPRSRTDIREGHTYFEAWVAGTEMATDRKVGSQPFGLDMLATAERVSSTFYLPFQYKSGMPPNWYWSQPCVINEYAYLWLQRDGTPTSLTKGYYDTVLGENATADQRRELYARYLAAVTEYWRATRSSFGVLYPFGLAGSIPGGATSDNFIDVGTLEFDRHFRRFVPDAFAAVGICAELWQTDFVIEPWRGTQAEFAVSIINDTAESLRDEFEIAVCRGETVVHRVSYTFEAAPYGLARTFLKFDLPSVAGAYEVIASVKGRTGERVRSHRQITLRNKGT